jgi:acyl-CoA thioesterase
MTDLADLLHVLELAPAGEGRFTAESLDEGHGVVFGGQLLAQSLLAAARSVPGKEVLSLHNVFARGASPAEPLDVAVDVLQSGRAFASTSVTTSQGDRLCTRATVLLHAPDDDLIRHASPMPEVAPPVATAADGRWWEVEVCDGVDVNDPDAVGPAELRVWTRFPGAGAPPPADDLAVHQALLAYASDGFLIGTAMRPHAGVGQSMAHVSISTTVLSQTITFHEPFDATGWLLVDHRSSYAGRGRSYGSAEVFTADGRLVASFRQDNMVRAMPEDRRPAPGDRAKY